MAQTSKDSSAKDVHLRNEELENYFSNTIIPQLFVDADMILRKFTPPAMKHFSLSNSDIGKNIEDIKENIRYPTLLDNITEVMVSREILEKEIQTTDKKWFQMNILPYLMRKENRMNGVIITFVDITDRIADLKELEKLNAEHDTLIYALSHDIRQPLSAIVLLADALKVSFQSRNEAQFSKWIDRLKTSSNTMKSIIDGFTNSSVQEVDFDKSTERINMESIVHDVLIALKPEISENGANITKDFKTSEVIFPRSNLRSILYNLLNNALKYYETDRALEIKISTEKQNGFVLLKVEDNGMGIAEENLEKIFEKSGRLNKNIEGTGMGLYIIRRMLENHGGRIEVESKLGEGSVFMVYFVSHYEGEKEVSLK